MSDIVQNEPTPERCEAPVPGTFSISEISLKTGVTPRQLYYWESIGLLSPAYLKFGLRHFRRYAQKDLEKLFEIKAWLEVGYTLEAVRKMQKEIGEAPAA